MYEGVKLCMGYWSTIGVYNFITTYHLQKRYPLKLQEQSPISKKEYEIEKGKHELLSIVWPLTIVVGMFDAVLFKFPTYVATKINN